ncbi:hypothetical protein ACFV9W_04225 [Streptomyces sp. NPDC059897]|uniref:hypothetical protein n=1 Tax=Streptomyces sp. NPDC059897 TaxID=3346994 RepID=UPI0036504656
MRLRFPRRVPSGRRQRLLLAAAACLLPAAVLAPLGSAAAERREPATSDSASSCFWTGPFTSEQDKFNFAYLDTGALYWASHYTLPKGAKLTLNGAYAHARYQSLNSYEPTAATPLTALNDQQIRPDPGSRNPFLTGAKRTFPKRDWTVQVDPRTPPKDPADQRPNTLYAGKQGSNAQSLVYRVYVPDRGRDVSGGVGLPEPVLTLADGTKVTGSKVCDALEPGEQGGPRVQPIDEYNTLREQPGKPVGFPASDPVRWHASYTTQWLRDCTYHDRCTPAPPRSVGQYSNLDNAYVSARLSRDLGPVTVLRGKLPTTPATHDGDKRMGSGQLRYWSMCSYEAWSTRVEGKRSCLYDEQLHPDKNGYYTVVVSRPEDRPRNATAACGIDWIAWPEKGDGAGHVNDGYVLMRNMLPAKSFTHVPQNTRTGDDEKRVMGPYLPEGSHTSAAAFEERGCSAA